MFLLILLPTIAGLVSAMMLSYNNISPKYQGLVESEISLLCEEETLILESEFIRNRYMSEALSKNVLSVLESTPKDNQTDAMLSYMNRTMISNPWLYTSWIAFEENKIWNTSASAYISEYMVLIGQGETEGTATEPVYYTDYYETLYYGIPKNTTESFTWTIPDYDAVYDFMYISATTPLYVNNQFIGVAGCDVDLGYVQDRILSIGEDLGDGYAMLIFNEKGQILAHPNEDFTFAKTSNQPGYSQIGKTALTLSNSSSDPNSELKTIIEDCMAGKEGKAAWTDNFVFYQQIPSTNMTLIFVYPQAQVTAATDENLITTLIIIAISSVIVGALIIFVSLSISRPLQMLSITSQKMAKGDLTENIKEIARTDEIGALWNNFKSLKDTLKRFILENKNMASQLSTAAEELSASAEEVSSASENIASSQQQISRGASNQVNAITETQRKFIQLNEGIRQIREKVDNISSVSDMIKNIANQTNMLALNAAIEAARAGDAGKGFNVVADQVRKLADESKKAVDNTDRMLVEIDLISKQQQDEAVKMLSTIDSIATVSEETSASTEESAAAAEEQASSMEMISSTSQQLLGLAEQLKALADTMTISEDDEKSFIGKTTEVGLENESIKQEVKQNFDKIKESDRIIPSHSIHKSIEITGSTIQSIMKSFLSDDLGRKILIEALGTSNIQSDKFYPAANFLKALDTIGTRFGQGSLLRVGSKIMESAVWPSNVTNLETALMSINEAYKMNHRPNDVNVIGKYEVQRIGDQFAVKCNNPYPCSFDQGLIKGIISSFDSKATMFHQKGSCRTDGDSMCVYLIKPGN